MKTSIAILALVMVVGCGDDSSELLGIYTLDSWTENDSGCGSEGPSVLEGSGMSHFYVKEISFFGQEFLNASLCPELPGCREDASDSELISLGLFSYAFESGSDSKGWTGGGAIAGGGGGGECSGEVFDYLMTDEGDGMVRIAVEVREVSGFPRDSDDFCDTDAAREAAEGQPCDRLEVLTGTFLEAI